MTRNLSSAQQAVSAMYIQHADHYFTTPPVLPTYPFLTTSLHKSA
jgi:hypothetical protein